MPDWSPVDLLPGLYVGLLFLGLAAALRRWYDPAPAPVLAVFGLAVAVLFGEALFAGRVLLPLDSVRGQVPFTDFPPVEPHGNLLQGDLLQLVTPSLAAVREAFSAGRWPLWNPRAGAGMPLLADPQSQALQPLALLGLPFPWHRAAGVIAALRVLLALTFFYLWLRRQRLGSGPALAGAFAYGLGGFTLLWVGWPLANSAALLPLLLYGSSRYAQEAGRRDLLLLGIGALALLLGGHPETVILALALAAAFFLAELSRRPAGERLPRLARAGLALAVAASIAAVALLPALDLLPRSLRVARGDLRSAPDPGGDALARRWLPLAVPNAYGNNRFAAYWGASNTNEDAGGFAGTATLLLALAGLAARRRLPGERLALGVAAACLVWLALPAFFSLPAAVASRRVLLLWLACLAYLGACALERFRKGELRRPPLLAAAAALAAVVVWGSLAHANPEDPGRLEVVRIGWLHWHLRFLVAATLLLALPRWGFLRRAAAAGIAVLVAAELLLAHGPANPPMPRQLVRPVNEPVQALRVALVNDPQGGRIAALGRAFPPNLASLYELSDARVYNPMAPAGYLAHLAPIIASWNSEIPELGSPEHPLYAELGVRYLLAAPGERLPSPWRLVVDHTAASIHERPDARPRLFLADPDRNSRLRLIHLGAQQITARGRSGGIPRRLASNLYQDGGWRMLLRKLSHPTGTQGPFLAAGLPPGRWRIDLLYRPRPFLWGCLLAALGVAAAAVLWVPPPSRRHGESRMGA
jgi:hypothetical protein